MIHIEWTHEAPGAPTQALEGLLLRVAGECVAAEGLIGAYAAGVLFTDDEGIHALNRDMRGVDRATDVLSFPNVTYAHGETARTNPKRLRRAFDPESGSTHLGDIAIAWPHVLAQAAEYGHSAAREAGFLIAHGMLHLLGYDHEREEDAQKMREMERTVLANACLPREVMPDRDKLLDAARMARSFAHAPYSRYPVGACVLTDDGRIFTGCNVENASYGLTLCAERGAVMSAIAAGARRITAVAVAAQGSLPYPCGACRQVLREFGGADMRVYVTCGKQVEEATLGELLPHDFGPSALPGDFTQGEEA